MPTKEKIIEELQWLSDRISTQVRTIGVGLLAIAWGLIIARPEIAGSMSESLKTNLLIVGLVAVGALVCDFLQYFFGYINAKWLLNEMEAKKLNEIKVDYTDWTYRLRTFFFWWKQLLLIVACSWFFIAVIYFCIKILVSGTT